MISLDFGQFEKLDFYHLPAHCAADAFGAPDRWLNHLVLPHSAKESASKGRRPPSSPPESSLACRGGVKWTAVTREFS